MIIEISILYYIFLYFILVYFKLYYLYILRLKNVVLK